MFPGSLDEIELYHCQEALSQNLMFKCNLPFPQLIFNSELFLFSLKRLNYIFRIAGGKLSINKPNRFWNLRHIYKLIRFYKKLQNTT